MFGKRQPSGLRENGQFGLSAVTDSASQKPIDEQLFDALDRAALKLIAILDDTSVDEQNRPWYSFQEKMAAFKQGENWLVKRQKLRPGDDSQEAPGVENLRALIAEEAEKAGFLRAPVAKGKGRPTLLEKEAKNRVREASLAKLMKDVASDDSKLQNLLKGAIPKEPTQ